MAPKTESKEIEGKEFHVTQWSAEKSIIMQLRLVKIFGASFGKLMSCVNLKDVKKFSDIKPEHFNLNNLPNVVSLLFESSSPEEIAAFMKQCIVGVACEGKKITDSTYTQIFNELGPMSIYKVFMFVIIVNYRDFIKGRLGEGISAKMEEMQ